MEDLDIRWKRMIYVSTTKSCYSNYDRPDFAVKLTYEELGDFFMFPRHVLPNHILGSNEPIRDLEN